MYNCIIVRAHLRKQNRAHEVLDKPVPHPPVDEEGNPVPMNQAQRTNFQNELKEYMQKDDIAFSDLMKACTRSPKAKVIAETGGFENAIIPFWNVFVRDFAKMMKFRRLHTSPITTVFE